MKAAVIAAGQGTRLAARGVKTPKPLVAINGEPMIARVIRMASLLGASSAACIINEQASEVADYLKQTTWPVPLELVVRTTPSSMESLFHLAPLLKEKPFLLFTVDAIFKLSTLKAFLQECRTCFETHPQARGVLALTDYVDDEKPLRAQINAHNQIIALGPAAETSPLITAGFYYFDPAVFEMVETARARKLSALRQFLALLIEKGYPLSGAMTAKTIDVDHPQDIAKAQAFLGASQHDR